MAITQQRDFLVQIPPFDLLPNPLLCQLADSLDVIYLPKASEIDVAQHEALFILIKGKVAEMGKESVVSHYSARGFWGDAELLGKGKNHTRYEVVDEAIAYKLPAKHFLQAVQSCDEFEQFFNASIVEKLNRVHQAIQSAASTEVMMDTVISAPIQALVQVDQDATLLEATQKMVAVKSDACLVSFADHSVGIITSTDVLKFVASGRLEQLGSSTMLAELAHKPVYSVHQYDYLFNALLKMTRYQIDRLAVRSDDGFCGFLHQKDLMSLFANQSGLVLTKIEQANSIDDLNQAGQQIDQLIKNLSRKGIKTHYIAKLVNELHRKMMRRLIDMALPTNLQQKVCVFVMGSEGRSEQVVRTDQDNGLIYADELSAAEVLQLKVFAERFSQQLQQLGFPPCPGDIMLSNPAWCLSRSAFEQKIQQWYQSPSEQNFMYAAILFDAQSVYGKSEWLNALKQSLVKMSREYPVFLRHFAISILRFKTPVGFFGGLLAQEDDTHDQLDIKKGGVFSLVHGVRCYALEANLPQTNTHWRIKALMDLGVFSKEFGIELGETLNFLNTLRLDSMLYQIEQGVAVPNNNIRLSRLSHGQQDLLKQSFRVVDDFKKKITHHFDLHGMS
ncbi:hypothetical protein THMIRHAS_14050 [Thiosulfatimonas sediminis]|uniref:Cyclic nucleotide-binding protein n=1 Tax=Thiosulfatimonas sediminis TaxID=2675054 RepID=A0A6F8PV61_9GAMM|nr:DUF294 nucleotidyltransferase-like domain-containing protein [Thiosulfatimonas sediminis]BBP46032.1 hypothetical protein THMIRHAS_14050 [Thiosulfatimonas sediminis]